jgi:hypothetical protein
MDHQLQKLTYFGLKAECFPARLSAHAYVSPTSILLCRR